MPEKIQEINKQDVKLRYLDKLRAAINLTDPPMFCKICGEQKSDFLNPKTGKIELIDCECEKQYENVKETYELFSRNQVNNSIRYSSLISGDTQPKSHEEKEIIETGRKLRETVEYCKRKLNQ